MTEPTTMTADPSAARDTDHATVRTAVLVTGAGGEMGHALVERLATHHDVVAIDLRPLAPEIAAHCVEAVELDVRDEDGIAALGRRHEFDAVFHLAALLSTRGERDPLLAQAVNVGGTMALLELAARQSAASGRRVKFLFPSSIAAYGLPDRATKEAAGVVTEDQFLSPRTMYGVNKLDGEHLGRFYAHHLHQLDADPPTRIDFRSIRFPGIVSADTVPSGGTSDYGPEMIHAAAKGEAYACFVREDARLPFMTMPEAIDALVGLSDADAERLTRVVYNVRSFAPSAGELAAAVRTHFADAEITYEPHPGRQGIVDGWPADVDDSAARRDWDWTPRHDLESALRAYLVPRISARYAD